MSGVARSAEAGGSEAVEQFFVHLSARTWPQLGALLTEGVERTGPFGDRITGRAAYLAFLRDHVPEDYGNEVHRVTASPDGRAAFARVTEHLAYPERTYDLEEVYAFGLDEAGAIERIEVYWQTPGQPTDGGLAAAR